MALRAVGAGNYMRKMFYADAHAAAAQVNSIVLMHFDGTNGSTTFTDVYGHAFTTQNGSPILSTTQQKFGPSSLLLTAANPDCISTPTAAAFGFGAGDFTIEAFVYLNSIPSAVVNAAIAGCWHAVGHRHWQFLIGHTYITFGIEGSYSSNATIAPVTGSWHHYAAVRASGTVNLYYDGTSVLSYSNSTTINSSVELAIGENLDASNWPLDGFVDEFRVSNVARYTSNFTPTTSAFTF